MQYKALSLLTLSATALAIEPAQQRRNAEAAPTDINIDIPDITVPDLVPTSLPIPSDLADLIPDSVMSSLTDFDYAQSLIQSVANGDAPDWISSLPDDKQSSFSSAASRLATGIASVSAQPTGGSGGSDDGDDSSGDGASTGAAPRATGAVAAGFAGVAGILGLAAAL